MEITRIDMEKGMSRKVSRIEFEIDEKRFTITEEPHGIRIHASDGAIILSPSVSNEIILSSTDR